jgi:hypothetical protein
VSTIVLGWFRKKKAPGWDTGKIEVFVEVEKRHNGEIEAVFGKILAADTERARYGKRHRKALISALTFTIFALRSNRRRILLENPSPQQLAKREFEFEDALLRALTGMLPRTRKRGRKTDWGEFIRLWTLLQQGEPWKSIEPYPQGTKKKFYYRNLPVFLSQLRTHFFPMIPENVWLPAAKRALHPPKR